MEYGPRFCIIYFGSLAYMASYLVWHAKGNGLFDMKEGIAYIDLFDMQEGLAYLSLNMLGCSSH